MEGAVVLVHRHEPRPRSVRGPHRLEHAQAAVRHCAIVHGLLALQPFEPAPAARLLTQRFHPVSPSFVRQIKLAPVVARPRHEVGDHVLRIRPERGFELGTAPLLRLPRRAPAPHLRHGQLPLRPDDVRAVQRVLLGQPVARQPDGASLCGCRLGQGVAGLLLRPRRQRRAGPLRLRLLLCVLLLVGLVHFPHVEELEELARAEVGEAQVAPAVVQRRRDRDGLVRLRHEAHARRPDTPPALVGHEHSVRVGGRLVALRALPVRVVDRVVLGQQDVHLLVAVAVAVRVSVRVGVLEGGLRGARRGVDRERAQVPRRDVARPSERLGRPLAEHELCCHGGWQLRVHAVHRPLDEVQGVAAVAAGVLGGGWVLLVQLVRLEQDRRDPVDGQAVLPHVLDLVARDDLGADAGAQRDGHGVGAHAAAERQISVGDDAVGTAHPHVGPREQHAPHGRGLLLAQLLHVGVAVAGAAQLRELAAQRLEPRPPQHLPQTLGRGDDPPQQLAVVLRGPQRNGPLHDQGGEGAAILRPRQGGPGHVDLQEPLRGGRARNWRVRGEERAALDVLLLHGLVDRVLRELLVGHGAARVAERAAEGQVVGMGRPLVLRVVHRQELHAAGLGDVLAVHPMRAHAAAGAAALVLEAGPVVLAVAGVVVLVHDDQQRVVLEDGPPLLEQPVRVRRLRLATLLRRRLRDGPRRIASAEGSQRLLCDVEGVVLERQLRGHVRVERVERGTQQLRVVGQVREQLRREAAVRLAVDVQRVATVGLLDAPSAVERAVDALLLLLDALVRLVGRRLDVQPHQVAVHRHDCPVEGEHARDGVARREALQLVLVRVARPVRRALHVGAAAQRVVKLRRSRRRERRRPDVRMGVADLEGAVDVVRRDAVEHVGCPEVRVVREVLGHLGRALDGPVRHLPAGEQEEAADGGEDGPRRLALWVALGLLQQLLEAWRLDERLELLERRAVGRDAPVHRQVDGVAHLGVGGVEEERQALCEAVVEVEEEVPPLGIRDAVLAARQPAPERE